MNHSSQNFADILAELKQMIVSNPNVNIGIDQIDPNQSLFEDGLALDSIILVDLIAQIEDRYNIEFSDKELRIEAFQNLQAVTQLISRKLGMVSD